MTKKPVTIKEIAKEAGVSIATVSMIFNNKDKSISQATREKVLEIAKEKDYIPNSMARSLVTRQSRTLGLVLPDIVNPFFPEIARGAEDKARQARYSIIICNTDDNLEQEDKYIDILTEKMVDGIIFAHSADRKDIARESRKYRMPIVLIDRDYAMPNVMGKVLIDNQKASCKGVNYLLEKGYKKIAYIAGSMNTQTAKDRLDGYKNALAQNKIAYDNRYVKIGEYKSQWGIEATRQLLGENIPFDAIFCGNDLIAIGAMKALKEASLRVPEDVGIMGFDDIYVASMVEPELTTIKQPIYEMGYRAAEILIDGIENKEQPRNKSSEGRKIILDTELIVRKSS